jgi:hypothetical protein
VTNDRVFGSDELTPELLRSATFDEQDGRIDAAQVREYLERVASSLEVFMSGDAPTALRAEFSRNAEIAQQILDAGQNASEQLRRQAAEEAKRILDEARDATLGLRETVEAEIGQARTQVEAMRGTFIQDLRDLYDRIGASLYRFERAAEESAVAPIAEPTRAVPSPEPEHVPERVPEPVVEPDSPLQEVADTIVTTADSETPEDVKPPAWRQLPAEAWAGGEGTPDADTSSDPAAPFQVVEDEPLAPGEPLVDLTGISATPEPAIEPAAEPPVEAAAAPAPSEQALIEETPGGSWLEAATVDESASIPPVAPQAVEQEQHDEPAPVASDPGGSWLEAAGPDAMTTPSPAPDIAHDDALAEALIGADPIAPQAIPPAVPPVPPGVEPASADAVAVRQQILDLLAAGQSRESVEAYLSNQLGLLNPSALIDAALGSAPGS